MKKQLVAITLAGLALASAAPAMAKNKEGNEGIKLGIKNFLNIDSKQFVVFGTINAAGSNTIIIDVKADANVSNITNGKVTVKTDANTKFGNRDKKITLTDLKAGQSIVIKGINQGSTLTATMVNLVGVKSSDEDQGKDNRSQNSEHSKSKNKVVGAVTAVTANSITITNSLTGTSQIITTDANTKVNVDGQTKAVADVQVGDKGWIRIKHIGATLIAKFAHLFR
jgi:hypothetical protein